jgi:hypothetical protein
MNAAGHSYSGWCLALMLINWLQLFAGVPAIAVIGLSLALALAFAGAAIWPDWDYKNSTISTAFGWFSQQVHKGVVQLHYFVADLTKDGRKRTPPGPHRGITHWYPFPPSIGLIVAAGCWWNKWVLFAVLVILYAGAIRAVTVPDYMARPEHTVRHRWSMELVHKFLDFSPGAVITLTAVGIGGALLVSKWFLLSVIVIALLIVPVHLLKRARRHVNRSRTVQLSYWTRYRIPVGKFMTTGVAALLAFIVIHSAWVLAHAVWMGAVVCLGMYLHILGDSPTEMGIPGARLDKFWRLPKWAAFRAGGPFEIVFLWVPMAGLGIYLIPGLRPHAEVMMVQTYIVWGLGILTVAALVIEAIARYSRKRRKQWAR